MVAGDRRLRGRDDRSLRIAPCRAPSCSASRASAARLADTRTRARENRRRLSAVDVARIERRRAEHRGNRFLRATRPPRPAADCSARSPAAGRTNRSASARGSAAARAPARLPASPGRAAHRPDASRAAARWRRSGPGARGRSRRPAARPPPGPPRCVGKSSQPWQGRISGCAANRHGRNILSDRVLRRKSPASPSRPADCHRAAPRPVIDTNLSMPQRPCYPI